jgi:small subunit ribosomal protein S2
MPEVTVKDLLESGVHFGHQTRRWNPKMKRFIFAAKNGIYIIDLNKTLMSLNRSCQKVTDVIESGGSILFVGTKKQAKDVIKSNASRCSQFYITERWLGGMLTNFMTIKRNIKRLKEIEKMRENGTFDRLTKKEVKRLEKEAFRMDKFLVGIRDMYGLPSLLFVIDTKKERIAVAEANKLRIPVIGILDTNSDPDPIDYPIAANDDAIKSISIITKAISDAVLQAQSKVREEDLEEAASEHSSTNEV